MDDLFEEFGRWAFKRVEQDCEGDVVALFTNVKRHGENTVFPETEKAIYEDALEDLKLLNFINKQRTTLLKDGINEEQASALPNHLTEFKLASLNVNKEALRAIQDYKNKSGIPLDTPPVDDNSFLQYTAFSEAAND